MAEEIINLQDEEILDEDTQKGKFMTFQCGHEYYGVPISYVDEITSIQRITAVPETENYIRGLINLRGKIVPVIDVRLRFQKEQLPYDDRTCIIVVSVEDTMVGLIVDTIAEVVSIRSEDICDPPKTSKSGFGNRYIYGIGKIGKEVKLLIDLKKLLYDSVEEEE